MGAFSQHFKDIREPRQITKITCPLSDVSFLTVCNVISGASGWEDIEDFGEEHQIWFQEKELFPQGLPAHDTIVRPISRLDPVQFRQRLSIEQNSSKHGPHYLDGKTLRNALMSQSATTLKRKAKSTLYNTAITSVRQNWSHQSLKRSFAVIGSGVFQENCGKIFFYLESDASATILVLILHPSQPC